MVIRNARPEEYQMVGQLMVDVYSNLDGFFKPHEQPGYYQMLTNVGSFASKPHTEILVAENTDGTVVGAVVYFGDMQYYSSGGTATQEHNAAGFRLLAVAGSGRKSGAGKALTLACVEKASLAGKKDVVIHSTKAMSVAWAMYERIGFKRSPDLDFMQGELPVFGFRFSLV